MFVKSAAGQRNLEFGEMITWIPKTILITIVACYEGADLLIPIVETVYATV